jgi:hypothetical protein
MLPLIAAVCGAAAASIVVAGERFDARATRTQLERRFADLRASRALPVDKPLLWHYRFTAADGRRLEALAVRLVERGYRIESLRSGAAGTSGLSVARIEQHSAASLERRNAELRGLAADFGVGSYDGADAAVAP